MLESF